MTVTTELSTRDMQIDLERFLKILHVELEHLCAQLDLLVDTYHEKHKRREVTEHVCRTNVATLQNEECGCYQFMRVVERLRAADYETLAAMVADVRKRFREVIEFSGVAPATYLFADEKISKVERYVRDSG